MSDEELFCAVCGIDATARTPDAVLDADIDNPELLCSGCGTAILVAPVVVWAFNRTDTVWSAPQQRIA
ncbi:hypothetical protein [Pilimelia columellifera]|uniref:Uncharacterized protein n=1 Tax=Pilimelia columellifera subsp. columellifera TaxID=706583 RepID=A0ABN3NT67_9ACTN